MTMARAFSVALVGLDGRIVEVETAIGGGLPRTVLVGLADTALYEARDRCRAAVTSAGLSWPQSLVTVNLSPASLPKAGSHYDIAIIAALLTAAKVVEGVGLHDTVWVGEVGLDGRIRPVRGVLPAVLAAAQHDFTRVVVPAAMAAEARLVEGMTVQPVNDLADLAAVLNGEPVVVDEVAAAEEVEQEEATPKDLMEVAGQVEARWALEVAAAGRHHLFLTGPPGVGKTLLAERLPGVLPPLGAAEALEVSAIHSLAGFGLDGLVSRPPYAAPHHSASLASLVGGGPRLARPGLISVAHRGVLFLDEAPEFSARMLDTLRTPLESGVVTIGRSQVQARFPANFQLVLAANPWPGGDPGRGVHLCADRDPALRRAAVRTDPRPDRHHPTPHPDPPFLPGPGDAYGRAECPGRRAGGRGPSTTVAATGRDRLEHQCRGARLLPAQPVGVAPRSGAHRPRGAAGPSQCSRRRPGAAAVVDHRRPGRARPALGRRPDGGAGDASR